MRLISLDLELNQPSNKIIEIGAICFQPDTGLQVGLISCNVNPEEPINPMITALTGIQDSDVCAAFSIQEAAKYVTDFKNEHQANPIGVVWGAGLSNDIRKIYEESGLTSPFRNRIIDVKATFQMLANVSQASMRSKVGLRRALDMVELGWDDSYGPPHRALADAYNTYRMYMFLSKCLKGGVDIKLG